jgi:DNA-binding response OmpR family regulator
VSGVKAGILIVDDHYDVRRMLRAGLQTLAANVQVTDVPSGEEAMLILATQPIDLLIADYWLPGISGLELKQRALATRPKLKIILITGVTDPQARQQVRAAGADLYFFKPLEMGELLAGVSMCLHELGVLASPAAPPPPVAAEPPLLEPASEAAPPPEIAPDAAPAADPVLEALEAARQAWEVDALRLLDARFEARAEVGTLPLEASAEFQARANMALQGQIALGRWWGRAAGTAWALYPGPKHLLALATLPDGGALLVIAPTAQREAPWAARLAKLTATLAARLESAATDDPLAAVVEDDDGDGRAEDGAAAQAVAAVFAAAARDQVAAQDVDDFWEQAAHAQADEVAASTDVLTWEQAQQLGLTGEAASESERDA